MRFSGRLATLSVAAVSSACAASQPMATPAPTLRVSPEVRVATTRTRLPLELPHSGYVVVLDYWPSLGLRRRAPEPGRSPIALPAGRSQLPLPVREWPARPTPASGVAHPRIVVGDDANALADPSLERFPPGSVEVQWVVAPDVPGLRTAPWTDWTKGPRAFVLLSRTPVPTSTIDSVLSATPLADDAVAELVAVVAGLQATGHDVTWGGPGRP
jgi:hypothetical protein